MAIRWKTSKECSRISCVIHKCRCHILIALDEAHGKQDTQEQCAKFVGVCNANVYNVIKYYVDGGIDSVL